MRFHFPDLVSALEQALQADLPGTDAQLAMAPGYRMTPDKAQVNGKRCREAGVLLAIYPSSLSGEATFILTKRRDHLPEHPGQISLPGGQVSNSESRVDAALREAAEEVAILREEIEIAGGLTPLFIPPSEFCVYPYVGILASQPKLIPHDQEVEAILEVPLSRLIEPNAVQEEQRFIHGANIAIPYFHLLDQKVWGATAMILSEFRAIWTELDHQFA